MRRGPPGDAWGAMTAGGGAGRTGLTNWAGNHRYAAASVVRPRSVEEVQEVVAAADRVRALGSRHSFTDLADTTGTLLSLADVPVEIDIDPSRRSVTVSGGCTYGRLAEAVHARGWALATMASLPHISIAGAVATGTHGSGDRTGSLAAAVHALEVVGADGERQWWRRGDPDFDGAVVALGALGVVTRVALDIEPTFTMRQDAFTDLPWPTSAESLDAVTGAADSVSLFTTWQGEAIDQVWLKSRATSSGGSRSVRTPAGATPARSVLHMLPGGDVEAITEQGGVVGQWHERLPHFRMTHTPSRGEELQSEYLVPRGRALESFEAMRSLAPRLAPVLQVSEIRTVAADDLWLSPASGHDVVGLHFTWWRDADAVSAVLPLIEAALLPLGARPHWGKCFVAHRDGLEDLYPRMADFRTLRDRVDPTGCFGNAFLDRAIGPSAH